MKSLGLPQLVFILVAVLTIWILFRPDQHS